MQTITNFLYLFLLGVVCNVRKKRREVESLDHVIQLQHEKRACQAGGMSTCSTRHTSTVPLPVTACLKALWQPVRMVVCRGEWFAESWAQMEQLFWWWLLVQYILPESESALGELARARPPSSSQRLISPGGMVSHDMSTLMAQNTVAVVVIVPVKIHTFKNMFPVSPEAPISYSSLQMHIYRPYSHLRLQHMHTYTHTKPPVHHPLPTPAMRMTTGTFPALFMEVDGSGLALGETSSGPVSWQRVLLLLVPVSLFISMLRSSLRKSLHPDPRWHFRITGGHSDCGAASLEGVSQSGRAGPSFITIFQEILKWCSGSIKPWLVNNL